MPALTRSLRSSTRLNTVPDEKKPLPAKPKPSTKTEQKTKKPISQSQPPPKAAVGRKRKAAEETAEKEEETKAEAIEDEDEPKAKPAKKAKKPAAGKKEAPPKKTKDELKALRDAPVPDVNSEVEPRDPPGPRYWLMKSEPDVRIEDGYEIKFSIDDLAAKKTPEGWEGIAGIRNYVARNNLRGMRKGDKAFFYHSNCKEPGVVGIMSIAKEHSPDWNACINDNPYYDDNAPHDGSKWSLVHVKIEHKFPRIVPLSLLKESRGNGPLQNMELLKQSRLSVNKVTREEWDEVIRMAKELDEDKEWDQTVEESKKFPNYSAA
ncbi:hypothetical protein CSAL01_05024 [Colletotrichum salicis]|uniref:Thymocyte nuclear protein 1 n=1 Tax=Colletotrichum salicis TaxID=1209931 RepID=A0A135S2P2_9PEZI|nr:hypothetical protein CSAL01_05024 [Colletotrichum salicis]